MYNQAIQGKQKLLDWYEKNKDFPYFFIFNPQNRDTVLDSSPNLPLEDYPFEKSFADLNHALTFLNENNTYGVRLQNKYSVNHKSNVRENYYRHIEEIVTKPTTSASVGAYGFDNDALIGKIEKRSEELFNQRWITENNQKLNSENALLKAKLEIAEAKIKEFEDGVDGRKFATMAYNDLKPLFPDLYASVRSFLSKNNTANIAGTQNQNPNIKRISNMQKKNNNPSNTSTESVEVRIEAALSKLFAADTDALETLEKIAEMAQNNRQKYDMAKGFM